MRFFLIGLILLLPTAMISQNHWNVEEMQPKEAFDNILVEKLSSDSLSSSFVIWVKESVSSHKHALHTESLYVIEGEGEMIIGDEARSISAGSYLVIPPATFHSVKVTSEKPLKVISVQAPEFLGRDRIFAGQLKRPQEK